MARERGRPRMFDMDEALDSALRVFWRHGFQGASLLDLTNEMGLSKPSIYAAFGDKEALYLKALDRYLNEHVLKCVTLLEEEPDARKAVTTFLHAAARLVTDHKLPRGCFIINGTADFGGTSTPPAVEKALEEARQGSESRLLVRLQQAQRDGQLPKGASPETLASLFASLLAGMGVLAKSGASREKLGAIINQALMLWPEADPHNEAKARNRR